MSDSRQAPAAQAPARRQRDPSARQAAASAPAGREPARGASTPARRRRPTGGDGAEGLPRPPSAGGAGAGGRAAACGQRAVTAPQSLRGRPPARRENLAARTHPAREPPIAPRRGRGGRPHREGVPRPRGARRPDSGPGQKVALPSGAARGPLPAAGTGVRAGGLNRRAGGRLPKGRTARGRKTTRPARRQVRPKPGEQLCRLPPASRGAGKRPPRPGLAAGSLRKFPARGRGRCPGRHPGPGLGRGRGPGSLAHTKDA